MLAFGMVVCGTTLHAQEQWDTYMQRYGAKPGSVLVDVGLEPSVPLKLFPYLVITGPKAKTCDAQGLPPAAEIEALEKVLDATGGMLSGATAKKLAGTFTYNCERLNYYYVRDTTAVRRALNRMYENHFKDYTFSLKIKYDPQWEVYRNFLYPDSTAQAWMATNKAMSAMLAAGDDLKQPRTVNYTLYFLTEGSRAAFADSAKAHSYTVGKGTTVQGITPLYELIVSRYGAVKMDSILTRQAELEQLAAPLHGNFKGWGAEAIPAAGAK